CWECLNLPVESSSDIWWFIGQVRNFHAGGANGHAGYRQSVGVGFFLQQAANIAGWHMDLDGIAADKGGMTGRQCRREAGLLLDGVQVLDVMNRDFEAVLFHMLHPVAAAATGR